MEKLIYHYFIENQLTKERDEFEDTIFYPIGFIILMGDPYKIVDYAVLSKND